MIVRRLTPDDANQAQYISSLGWESLYREEDLGNTDRFKNWQKPLKEVSDSRMWGAFTEDGVLSTSFTEIAHQIRFDGDWYRSCAIGGVVTRPDMRRMGAVRECLTTLFDYMRQEGIPFATLLPFDVPFYRKFGYEGIYRICNIMMPVRTLYKYKCDISHISELGGEKTLPELNQFYEETIADMNMALKRDKKLWSGIVNFEPRTNRRYTYIRRDENGVLSGFMTFVQDKIDNAKTMKVVRFVYRDVEALQEMLGFIYTFVAHYENVLFYELPLSLDFYLMMEDYNSIKYEQKICNMLRVGDVEKTLNAKRYPEEEGKFSIKVTDSLDWNCGIYDVSFGAGSCHVTKRSSGDYDLAVDEKAFARIAFGEEAIASDVMRFIPNMEIVSNKATLEKVFIKRPIFHSDFY